MNGSTNSLWSPNERAKVRNAFLVRANERMHIHTFAFIHHAFTRAVKYINKHAVRGNRMHANINTAFENMRVLRNHFRDLLALTILGFIFSHNCYDLRFDYTCQWSDKRSVTIISKAAV